MWVKATGFTLRALPCSEKSGHTCYVQWPIRARLLSWSQGQSWAPAGGRNLGSGFKHWRRNNSMIHSDNMGFHLMPGLVPENEQ